MIKSIMKKKNVDDIETMIHKAQAAGVRFIACTMSMELMGIKKEELIDGIEYAASAPISPAMKMSGPPYLFNSTMHEKATADFAVAFIVAASKN